MKIDITKKLTELDLLTPVEVFMTPFQYTFLYESTVEEARHLLQTAPADIRFEYFYVTDDAGVLQGVLSAHDLLYSAPSTPLSEIYEPKVVKLEKTDALEKGLHIMATHKILVIPVVDENNRFLGVLEVSHPEEDALVKSKRLENKQLKDDIFQFIGVTIDQGKPQSSLKEFRFRLPWLSCNLVGGLICAFIGEFFKETLKTYVILAVFIPLVLTLSESIAIQSMTLSLRFLHFKKIAWKSVWRRLFAELKVSLLLGIYCAIAIGLVYLLWTHHFSPLMAIGISLIITMCLSSGFGVLFPVILHALKKDPKVAAGPVILMITDIMTIAIYLMINTFLLNRGI